MSTLDEQGRPEPPWSAGELETLEGFLEFQRATFAWRTSDLNQEQLNRRLPGHPSTMTLAGMIKHLSFVEFYWFEDVFSGQPTSQPWVAVDWSADHDWDWNSAAEDSPEYLRELWRNSVERSRQIVADAVTQGPAEALAASRPAWGGKEHVSLRWILTHMIEEYARHNGHADLLREPIDGQVGE